MHIVALDIATKCGFAVRNGNSGVWSLGAKRDQSAGIRTLNIKRELRSLHLDMPIDLLVFEAARNAGPKMQGALVVQAELQGVVKSFCEEKSIEYRGYSPSEIKKFATGKGNAKKHEMITYAEDYFGITCIDDNHADALWLLELAIKDYDDVS